MQNGTYNGWTNYETWNVALWIDNDEPMYRERVRRAPHTAASVEELARELMPEGTPDFDDMGQARAYDKVNWQEIADNWNDEEHE